MVSREMRVAIIGAGAAGIASGIKLREAGIEDFVIFEKAADLGGTWRDNTYPGLTCDVPSHLYRYSFAPNPDWTSRYSPGAEIQDYFRGVAQRHGIEAHIRYECEVTAADWEDGAWRITTVAGDEGLFDAVISAVGVLHHPVWPDIEGLADFAGACFHTARWDHDVALAGKRVGIIGTGSTAVQILPAIVDEVGKVSLFQRTAQWILPEPNEPIPEEKKRFYREHPGEMDRLYEWLCERFNSSFAAAVVGENPEALAEVTQACEENLETNVRDPELRERLRPDYKVGCKRLIVSDRFYPAIQKPNAELVDAGIERVEPRGVCTKDGCLHELDVLVCATGFDTHRFMRPMRVIGRDERDLETVWSEANEAYRSVAVPEFPNFFMIGGPNSPIGNFSYLMTIETVLGYIMQLVTELQAGRAREIAPKQEPTRAYNAAIREAMPGTVWATGCNSWYIDRSGNVASWPWTYEVFQDGLAAPAWDELEVR